MFSPPPQTEIEAPAKKQIAKNRVRILRIIIFSCWLQLKVFSRNTFHFENIYKKTQLERRRFCIDYQGTPITIVYTHYFLLNQLKV